MTRRTLRIVALAAGAALVAAAAACGSADSASGFDRGEDAGEGDGGGQFGDAGINTPIPSAGLVVVHAAAFPAFRLCFSNFPDRLPFPDRSVMPNSNVVGVEVGSVVRLDPLATPGEVYVIDEKTVKASADSPDDKPCRDLICEAGAGCLRENLDWVRAGTVNDAIGAQNVDVLAITGCGNVFFLQDVGATSDQCGSGWNDITGNLAVRVLPLQATMRNADVPTLPVQLVHMSQLVDAQREAGVLEVTYGAFDGGSAPLANTVATDPTLFDPSMIHALPLPMNDESIFASQGFRIAIRSGDAGASLLVDTSLAQVQSLSAPRDVPSDYYRAASSYALLLLGDPANPPVFTDGGANAGYDPRRGVHLLAIPVAAPAPDAGPADAGSD